MIIKGLNFVETSIACPEQYDVYDSSGNQRGYVRYRWGVLRCDFPYSGGETIYKQQIGDNFDGCLGLQQDYYLNIIADKILEKLLE